jgi:MFS family permease
VRAAYGLLFAVRPARRLVVVSLLGRLSTGAYPIPLILLIQGTTHSYALAGVAEATNLAAAALTGPARGRALDRFGSRRAIPPIALTRAAALALLWPVATTRVPVAIILVTAVAGIAAPALPTAMRLQWQRLLAPDDGRLPQAYAFEALAQVFLFVAGPLLAAFGIATVGPGATLLATAGLLLAGALPFALLAVADDAKPPPRDTPRVRVIRLAGLQTLVIATVAADAALGIVDIAVTAFAKQHGNRSAAGLLLAVFCLASVLGGAAYGARRWRATPSRRLPAILAVAALLYLPLAAAVTPAQLAGLLAIAGTPFAAQWTTTYLVLDQVAPHHASGEAMSWISAANAAGVGLGYLLAGAIVQTTSTTDAFLAAAGLLAGSTLFVLTRQPTLTQARLSASPQRRAE